jgi:hypothetical protein
MYDFSIFEFSSTKIGLCAAIVCAAIVSGLPDIFRIHNMFNINRSKNSIDLSKLSGAFHDRSATDWEIRPLVGKQVPRSSLIVPLLAIGLLISCRVGSTKKLSAIGAGNSDAFMSASLIFSHCCAAAASEGVFFDAFSGEIQAPATVYMIFATFLMFCAAWDLLICMTTEPTLGPILRGIIQVKLIFYLYLPS